VAQSLAHTSSWGNFKCAATNQNLGLTQKIASQRAKDLTASFFLMALHAPQPTARSRDAKLSFST
jgi:hypothetical protein